MFKLYVALVFNALAFGYVGAPETELPIQNDDDGTNPLYDPLILLVKNNQISKIFNFNTESGDSVRFSEFEILNQDPSPNQLQADEQVFYLCSRDTFPEYSFDMRFESEPRRCVREPVAVTKYQNGTSRYCKAKDSMKFGIFAIAFCIIDVERYEGQTNSFHRRYYNFIQDKSQGSKTWYKVQHLELYQFCYNDKEKRIEWTERDVKPSSLLSRKRAPNQESIFTIYGDDTNMVADFKNQNFNEPHVVPHKLVPSEENSFKLWDVVTSQATNRAPLWSHFEPLLDLIDERLQRVANRLSTSIKIKTQLIYRPTGEAGEEDYVNGENKHLEIPRIWVVHARIVDCSDMVTVVVHNSKTLQKPPRPGVLCKGNDDLVNCDFKKWKEISPHFHEILQDDVLQFAYCCKAAMFAKNYGPHTTAIDMNFDRDPENHGETTIDGRW